MAYAVLIIGWLGPFDGHFSWYANLFFLLALLFIDRPQRSSILGFIALALAISFLFYKKIAVSEAPTYKAIVAYGWGYALWITSFTVFSTGQLLRALGIEKHRITLTSLVSCTLVLVGYMTYYFIGDNSLFSIRTEREHEFKTRCATAGEHIFKKANGARGIFFDPDWGTDIGSDKSRPSFKYITGGGVLGLGLVNSGYLKFYETRDQTEPDRYLKYVRGEYRGSKSTQLESEFAVLINHYQIPPRLNIYGATVSIKDLRDNALLATATVFLDVENGKLCGDNRGWFSTRIFVPEVLGLTGQNQTVPK